MVIHPFNALRSTPGSVQQVASVPYDVVNRTEAAGLAAGNFLSFLRVVRSEIDLPEDTDPYSEAVYRRASDNLESLCRQGNLVEEGGACLYGYRMTVEGHTQLGLLACCRIDDYESGVIKKHELTRRDKEDDRTRHILATGAQTGPVLMAYRDSSEVADLLTAATNHKSDLLCDSETGGRHEIWQIADTRALLRAFEGVPHAYIADGHHRSASAARARAELRAARGDEHTGQEEYNYFLTAMFPASQMKILAYNRVVKDLGGHSPEELLKLASEKFDVAEAVSPQPERPMQICAYVNGTWYGLTVKPDCVPADDPVRALDCSLLQELILEPILGIKDVRVDQRISFVGGIRGTEALEQRVAEQGDGIAFSMYPTSIAQLFDVADADLIMPPKSTWFEPKLRSGMVVHRI